MTLADPVASSVVSERGAAAPKVARLSSWWWAAVVVLALLGAAHVGRYQVTLIVPGGESARLSMVSRLDRWTGRVEVALVFSAGQPSRPNNDVPWLTFRR